MSDTAKDKIGTTDNALTWKETSAGLLAKAWVCADEASKAAESSGLNPLTAFAMQQAQFLALVAIYKLMDEMFTEQP